GKKPQDLKRDDYVRATVDNKLPRLNKVQLNNLGGFSSARNLYFPVPLPTKEEIEAEMKEVITQNYVNYVETYGITPSVKVVQSWGYTSHQVNKFFGSAVKMYIEISKKYPNVFRDLVNDTLFTN